MSTAGNASNSPNGLFQPARVGDLVVGHRIALAPLTRGRAAEPSLSPGRKAALYYTQRATAGGLLVSEATNISPDAVGFAGSPGIWTAEQVAGWRAVTTAVHGKGGLIFCQLWHTGRQSHPNFKEHPLLRGRTGPLSSSSRPTRNRIVSYKGTVDAAPPKAMTAGDIAKTVADYRRASRNAVEAGFDGVEIHSAHAYLLDQFILDGVNDRTDEYGGSIPNRIRFPLAVVSAVCDEIGSRRVAVRLSPFTKQSRHFGATDRDPVAVYSALVAELNRFDLAYLLISEPRWNPASKADPGEDELMSAPLVNGRRYRSLYKGTLVGAGGFTPSSARAAVEDGTYDLVAFGRWFISNPDLPHRIRIGAPLTVYNRKTFYVGGDVGYVDYPTIDTSTHSKYPLIEQNCIGSSLKDAKPKAKL